MNILVTGSNGFIGKHVCLKLKRLGHTCLGYDLSSTDEDLLNYVKQADFIIHLAGINRPLTNEEFYNGNANLTKKLIDVINSVNKKVPIIFTSSIQATLDNDYGKSKKMGEDFLFESGLPVYIFRLANVFGKWCRPNYNSAAATFCYNIAHDLPVEIRDRNYVVNYNYIDDIVDEFVDIINQKEHLGCKTTLSIKITHPCSLGRLVDLLYYFKKEIESPRHLPLLHDEFEYKLFKTFCDYLSDDGYTFNYATDDRGSFEELYKSKKYGQISDNMSYPGIVKGGHYHKYKKEIFYTVIGTCEIKQRNIMTDEMVVNIVSGDKAEPIDIKVGYTHSIKNIGDKCSHTIMWISEIYDPSTHDTYREDVEK